MGVVSMSTSLLNLYLASVQVGPCHSLDSVPSLTVRHLERVCGESVLAGRSSQVRRQVELDVEAPERQALKMRRERSPNLKRVSAFVLFYISVQARSGISGCSLLALSIFLRELHY
jgi:hypothetical protein